MSKESGIKYIREEIPEFEVPSYSGERYEAMVPDTLDLQERCSLAINGLTGPTDPKADYEIYFWMYCRYNPPRMPHDYNGLCGTKFWEALPLMRLTSGSNLNMHVEKRWMEVMLHLLGPDGLAYWPVEGRPWATKGLASLFFGYRESDKPFAIPLFCGRQLAAMTVYSLLESGSVWKQAGRDLVDGLIDIAIDKGNYAYFPESDFTFGEPRAKDAKMPIGVASSTVGWVIQGLAQYYRATGYEPAIVLSGKLARYLKDYGGYYDRESRFHLEGGQDDLLHFHGHTLPLLGLVEHALVTGGDRELLEFAHKGYRYGKANGNVLVGYFPEVLEFPAHKNSETCAVADMIALGLKLTQAGVGDYWDDVDRWVRNQLAENQLLHADWVYRMAEQVPPSPVDETYQTADRVPERNVGAFAGWPSPNDWFGVHLEGKFALPHYPGIMHCCTGNGTRALYYVWKNILHYSDGKLRVNLLLNRASPWADVDSHIPYTGQVDVKVKQKADLSIRIPEWVKPEEVRVTINSAERRLTFDGRYANVGSVKPGDVVTMTFPIEERTDKVFIEKKEYALVRKGNDVVCIDPPGYYHPLYQRAHYRVDHTRWRKITRFVAEKDIDW